MTHPFRPSTSVPRGCGGDRCASGRDAWPLHHVRHEGVFCRLCSSCVLLYHPSAYCSACLLLISPDAGGEPRIDPALAPPGPTATCSDCGLSVAHLSCLPGDPDSFLCPPCAAANEGRPFSFTPPAPIGSGGRRVLDERAARVLLVAARLANDSVGRAAAAAREEAERCVAEAAAARKRSREMLDNAFRALEAEAQEDKKPPPAAAQPQPQPQPPPPPPKKKTPKSNEANRDRDKLLKLNAMQQPALAFAAAAAAAAAATSMPLPTPPSSSKEEKKPVKQEPQGSVPNRAPLFGALQS